MAVYIYHMKDFIHLHNHSDYSLLQSTATVSSLVQKAKELNMKHLALTDLGNMSGCINFYNECVQYNINPVIGQEFNLASGKETKIIDLAKMINEEIGNESGMKFIQRRKWDTKSRLLASIDKAKGLIGYNPKTEFKIGLMETINWFRKNWDKIERSASFGPGMSSAVRDK